MMALTLHQPWSWAIAHAGKRVENRTWAPPSSVIGKRVAIHAGLRLDKDAVNDVGTLLMNACNVAKALLDIDQGRASFVHGAVESVATIAGCVDVREFGHHKGSGFNKADVVRSIWFSGPIGWVLDDVIALPDPVPCKGAQGLWTLPDEVESAVLAQLPEVKS